MSLDILKAYYRRQGICPEAEWPQFLEALRTPLPAHIVAVIIESRLLSRLITYRAGGRLQPASGPTM